jgi:IS5 family transposase
MLRMYCLQQWYSLADEALEDAIYDSQALRNFVGIDLGKESVPDATTLLGFRHLLEKHDLTKTIFETVNRHLRARGLLLNKGTLTDATILAAPSSTKNKEKARDPQMHQTRKGKQWYFGMKAHIGADADSVLVHTVVGTAANVSDVTQTEHLLHGEEEIVFADAGYIGADKRQALRDKPLKWHIAMKRGKLKAMAEGPLKELTRRAERLKAQLRSRVEHPFHVMKNLFGHRKVRYKGLAKNTAQLHALFALANLVVAADSTQDGHRFRCEDGRSAHVKTTTHSRGRRPLVGAKRRGGWHCYSEGVVAINFAWRFRMDSPFRLMR